MATYFVTFEVNATVEADSKDEVESIINNLDLWSSYEADEYEFEGGDSEIVKVGDE